MSEQRSAEDRGGKGPTVHPWLVARWLMVLVACAIVLVGTGMSVASAFLAALFSIVLVFGVDPGVPLSASLLMLIVCPVMVALNQRSAANGFAMAAYYFLAMGMALLFIEHVKERSGNRGGQGD